MRRVSMLLSLVLFAAAPVAACKGQDNEPFEAAKHEAALKCERLAACYQVRGNTTTVDTACDYDTLHVVTNCKNGCITRLWDEHDALRNAGQPIPTACRCIDDSDCASELRRCDTATGACLGE